MTPYEDAQRLSVYAVPVSPLSSAGPLQERFGERRRWSMYEVAPERGVHESLTSGRLAAQVAERAERVSGSSACARSTPPRSCNPKGANSTINTKKPATNARENRTVCCFFILNASVSKTDLASISIMKIC